VYIIEAIIGSSYSLTQLKRNYMVKLKIIVRDGNLVLRISEGKQRFYKSVRHLLKGNPNIEKHWNADKERFTNYAVSYSENNKALEDFKSIYSKLVLEHPEYTARQIASAYTTSQRLNQDHDSNLSGKRNDSFIFVEKYLELVIEREKVKNGCNFEVYGKLLNKCRKVICNFSHLTFQEMNYDKCLSIAHTFAKHRGYRGISKTFRALLGKASKDKEVDFSINQIGDFHFADYNPNKDDVELKKPDVLNSSQLKLFLNMNVMDITPEYEDRQLVELYYDFCVFMFNSFFAPCDVIKLKYKHITKHRTIIARRKKTHKAIEIPISPAMEQIINKYMGKTKDGYVFPIMDDKKEKEYETKDYTFKKFRQNLNIWLKPLGKELGLNYDLYAYVFRHTAITVALDGGLPISYVAMAAGTSIEMIQEHYYNGDNIANQKKLQLEFIKAGR